MQGGLVILDGQQVVGTPFEDGGGDLGLAPHGVDSLPLRRRGVTSAPFSSSLWSNSGMAVISLDLTSVASCPRTSRWREAHAETMCSGWRPLDLA